MSVLQFGVIFMLLFFAYLKNIFSLWEKKNFQVGKKN